MEENNLNIGTLWEYSRGEPTEETLTTLKMKINQFIFLNGCPSLTLREANKLAEDIWVIMQEPGQSVTAFKDPEKG